MLSSFINYVELRAFELLILMVFLHDFVVLKADSALKQSPPPSAG